MIHPAGRSWLLVPMLLILALSPAVGERLPALAGTLDLPSGWTGQSGRFQNRSGDMVLSLRRLPGAAGHDPRSLFEAERADLEAKGEGAPFDYSGLNAFIGDITLPLGSTTARGYLITIAAPGGAVALLGYSRTASYDRNYPELLSALDSFALRSTDLRLPGPISQFLYPLSTEKPLSTKLAIGDTRYSIVADVREMEASQTVIGRETAVLAENKRVNPEAWRRFYRMIFRDSYQRVEAYLPIVTRALKLKGKSDRETAEALLGWIQGFLYARTGTTADLSNPLLTMLTQTGDCDSRTLLYALLLDHLGVPAILMVSAQYSHSMVGVDVPGAGARFSFRGKAYLVAELTAEVPIGRIDSAMADPRGWLGIDLSPAHPMN